MAAISFLAPIVAKLGALSLLAFFPVVGGVLAALWYGVEKPILSWCASKFFYPHYMIPEIKKSEVKNLERVERLVSDLGVAQGDGEIYYTQGEHL